MAKQTPLYDRHLALGGRMTEFAGREMPVQYTGIGAEHAACREAGALFDICHMGEIELRAADVRDVANRIVSNDLSGVPDGSARYGFLLNERGGVIDDLITFVFDSSRAMIVTNAANTARDLDEVRARAPDGCTVTDVYERTGKINLQGPRSREIAVSVIGDAAGALGRFRFAEVEWRGGRVVVSRTGYTGEVGYELFAEPGLIGELWDALLEEGRPEGPVPAGLGKFVALGKAQGFVGRRALLDMSGSAPAKRLVGLEMLKRSVPRAGYDVTDGPRGQSPCAASRDRVVGRVTSGTMSPTLGKGIALAYVESGAAEPGCELGVMIRGRAVPCAVVETPFYRGRKQP